MTSRPSPKFGRQICLSVCLVVTATLALPGCGLEMPEAKPVEFERFDLSQIPPARPSGAKITGYAVEYVADLGISSNQPGHDSEVRVVLPSPMPAGKVPALVFNGAGAYLFSGMVLSDADIEAVLPYVEQGFAIVAYETDGCQPSWDHDPTAAEIAQMTRKYVASKAGLINAKRALSYALARFPEIDGNQIYAVGHSSGGKQALLLAAHDERIRGCVAFAPACQMDFGSKMTVARIGGADGDFLAKEVERSMPLVHAKVTTTPTLLVYSPSDRVTRPSEVLTYAKAVGDAARAIPVQCEGHGYVPEAGFKLSLAWLQLQLKKNMGGSRATQLVSQPAKDPVETLSAEQPTPSEHSPPSEHSAASEGVPQQSPEQPAANPLPRNLNGTSHGVPAGIQQNPYVTR